MLEALFRSRVTVKVLDYFMKNQENEIYLREIGRELSEPASAVRRELDRLEDFGLLGSRAVGNHKYFSVRKDFPLLPELRGLFLKTEGAIDYLKGRFTGIKGVQLAFVYGDFAEKPSAAVFEIGIVIVGLIEEERLKSLIDELQRSLARRITYSYYNPGEFGRLLEEKDPSLTSILNGEKIVLAANVTSTN